MNETIKTQLNHRSIRAFKEQELTKEEVELLVDVARHTATSKFMQAYSIISITDPTLKAAFSAISKQPYVENNGHLFLLCDFQSVTLQRCVTNKPPAMRVRIEGYTKKTPIAIQ